MLASPARRVPTGADWAHEVKWDGMRLLADVHDGRVRLTTRTERDVTVAFPELSGLAGEFADMLLDGEAVVMRDGIPSFAALAERFHVTSAAKAATLAARAPVTFMVFDLLRLYGVDLTARSWTDRRATLERLELTGPHWQVPPPFTDGDALWQATRERGLEVLVGDRSVEVPAPLTTADCPFTDAVPADDALGTTWVHPVLVCDVHALGLTNSRRLRQPAYRGLRPDLTPGDIDPGELPDA